MSLTPQLIDSQWQTYLSFLYNFYFQHNQLPYFETIAAKFYKEPGHFDPLTLSFVVAGLQTVQHTNQNYTYQVTERLIRAYDLILPRPIQTQQHEPKKHSESQRLLNEIKLPQIQQTNKLFYEKDITCFEDIILTQKRATQYDTSVTFYAVALKNESIRILNASKLAGRPCPKRLSFLSQRSPFLVKNANLSNFSVGNPCEAAIIPLQKQVTTIKFNSQDMLLLCGCADGSIAMIDLNQVLATGESLSSAFKIFTYHKRPIKDLSWMTYSFDEKNSFFSLADDGCAVWDKQNNAVPVQEVSQVTRVPLSLIEVYPDQFLISGRDCSLKFFDIKKASSYIYYESTEVITKLYNLTGQIEYTTKAKKQIIDNSLRFVACESSGNIVFWQGERQFQHRCHKSKITGFDFVCEHGGLYLAVEKEKGRLSIFSPIILTNCLKQSD